MMISPSKILDFYKKALDANPHLTNVIVSMTISSFADTTAQLMENSRAGNVWGGFDIHRNLALAATAAVYNGLILTSWLMTLSRLLPQKDTKSVLGKLAATQGLLQPCVYVPFFFIFHGLMMGESITEISGRLTSEYTALLFRLWSLFMLTRFMMFLIIPTKYQVLWDSSVSFIWQLALSLFDASKRQPACQGLVSSVMDFEAFGYLLPRERGSPFLPQDSSRLSTVLSIGA